MANRVGSHRERGGHGVHHASDDHRLGLHLVVRHDAVGQADVDGDLRRNALAEEQVLLGLEETHEQGPRH